MRFRNILPAIAVTVSLAGCAVYREGSTPDDVYYSPAREKESYVAVDKKNDNRYNERDDYYNSDDNYLRMRVRGRYRWSAFDDYYYMNDWQYGGGYYSPYHYSPYGYAYNHPNMWYSLFGFNAYWNSYYSWNSYYNPYCPGIIVVSPKTNPVAYSNVRNFRLSSYTNTTYSNRNTEYGNRMMHSYRTTPAPNARYNNTNGNYRPGNSSNNSLGGSLRKVFSGINNNNNSSNDSYYNPSSSRSSSSSPSSAPVRSYTPSSSSSSDGGYSPSRSGGSNGGGSSNGRSTRGG